MATTLRSKKQALQEFKKCGRSPKYFLKTYAKIAHPTKGLIPFDTWNFQDDLLDKFTVNKLNIIGKSRQLGISTIVGGYVAWLIIFNRAREVYITSIKIDTAKILLNMVKTIINNLPSWFHQFFQLVDDNKQTISLTNNSRVRVGVADNAARGQALSLLVIDEAAFIDGLEEFWTALQPTITAGGRVIALSCVTKDTFVFTNNGIQQIEDFIDFEKEGGYETKPYEVFGRDKTRKGDLFFNNGLAKTKKITTRFSQIEGSYIHKVWAYSNGTYGWKELQHLKEDDWISIQKGMNIWGQNDDIDYTPNTTVNHENIFSCSKITPELSYMLGMFLAKDSTYKVKNENDDLVGGSKTFLEFLEYLGFDLSLKAKEKVIPKRLLQMSKENIISLLQGIFDGDGWSHKDKGYVGIGLASEKMIDQIRMILLNFGILSTKTKYNMPPTEEVKVSSTQYRLEMNSLNSKLFYDLIGFDFDRKQNNKKNLEDKIFNDSFDILPNNKVLAKELFSYYEKDLSHLELNQKIYLSDLFAGNKENISRSTLLKLFNIVKDKIPNEYRKEIEKNLCENLVWVPIQKIEESENEVYDFSLPDNKEDFWAHSVIYNGILGHQTPNGTGDWFEKTYNDALANINDWVATELKWDLHPERDAEWEKTTRRSMSKRAFAQEYEVNFQGSGDTFIDPENISLYENNVKTPNNIIGYDRKIWIFEDYEPTIQNNYIISVDCAKGGTEDGDPWAFHVVRLSDMTQCAEGQTKLDIESVSKDVVELARMYDEALVVVENNSGWGVRFLEKLVEMGYTNIYCSEKVSGEYVEYEYLEGRTDVVMGISTNSKTRDLMLGKFEEYILQKKCNINSSRLVKEMRSFIWKNSKPQARKGKHDDLIMSWAIACYVRDQLIKGQHEHFEKMFNALSAPKVSKMYIDTNIPGMPGFNARSKLIEKSKEQKKIQENFMWLYMG